MVAFIRKHICIAVVALATILGACVMAPQPFDEAAWQRIVEGQAAEALYAPNSKGGIFFNPWMPMQEKGFGQFLRWRFSRNASYTEAEKTLLPATIPDLHRRMEKLADQDYIAWIGHATFLIRTNGTYWITDPMLSKRALLPARLTPPALDMEFLEQITDPINVVISHSHYDHLDKASIRALPAHARIFVPLGLKAFVQTLHAGAVREMDWWESLDVGKGISLTCLPAQHWSRRIGQDFNTTLWASYLIKTPESTIYYGGDSGYFVGYREFGRRYAGIDYALIPLTAYHPRWFMHYAHMDAAESIRAFQDLGAQYYIPTQWGTFRLGDNPPGYPVLDLQRQIDRMDLDPAPFLVMDLGEIRIISGTN
jgi:N-acyl-phosphatidylethanolamine-hydrolysing phospholipase D